MQVEVIFWDSNHRKYHSETLSFQIKHMNKNSLVCVGDQKLIEFTTGMPIDTFHIHRNVFNKLREDSFCQLMVREFGGGQSVWLATMSTM